MKKLGWLLFFCSINIHSQDVIISPPISIEPAAGREIVQENTPVGSLIPAKLDPIDGQLKLKEQVPEEISIPPREDSIDTKLVLPNKFFLSQKYLQFSFGYLNSKWKKADSSLENGSSLTDFRVVSDMNDHNQFGFAIELIQDSGEGSIPDNIRALQYKIFIDYHGTIFTDKLDWITGLALSVGDYSIRKLGVNTDGLAAYTKLKSGTLFGVIPSAGLRFYLGGRNSIDISIEYHQYLSNPQRYIGGFAFVPRFSFAF